MFNREINSQAVCHLGVALVAVQDEICRGGIRAQRSKMSSVRDANAPAVHNQSVEMQ